MTLLHGGEPALPSTATFTIAAGRAGFDHPNCLRAREYASVHTYGSRGNVAVSTSFLDLRNALRNSFRGRFAAPLFNRKPTAAKLPAVPLPYLPTPVICGVSRGGKFDRWRSQFGARGMYEENARDTRAENSTAKSFYFVTRGIEFPPLTLSLSLSLFLSLSLSLFFPHQALPAGISTPAVLHLVVIVKDDGVFIIRSAVKQCRRRNPRKRFTNSSNMRPRYVIPDEWKCVKALRDATDSSYA